MNKPTDSVRIVIFNTDRSKFLVLTESDDPDNWKLPGGKFDSENEQADKAAYRELFEELRISRNDAELINVSKLTNDDGVSARYIYMLNTDENVPKPSNEISVINWINEKSIPDTQNKNHILSAVRSAKASLVDN